MPEVFRNVYNFASVAAVPSKQRMADALCAALQRSDTPDTGLAGERGAPRDWLRLPSADGLDVWVFWEANRPAVEVQAPEPIEAMLHINAAMAELGGVPESDDAAWRTRQAIRRRTRWVSRLAQLLLLAGAVAAIVLWGWWGVLGLLVVLVVGAVLWTISLARAFGGG